MKKFNFLYVLIFSLILTSCRQSSDSLFTPMPTDPQPSQSSPETSSTPSPTELSAPTPELNAIEAALATQNTIADEERAARPTPIPMPDNSLRVISPDGNNEVVFALVDGVPYYSINRDANPVIFPSKMGFEFLLASPLNANLSIVEFAQTAFDETWTQPWGEVKEIRDHHNELRIRLTNNAPNPLEMVIVFRAFDDGVGFRYEFPEQPHLENFQIMDEVTEFAMTDDHSAWWIAAYQNNRYEYLYRNSKISNLSNLPSKAVHTPFTIETTDGLFLSIHEAVLTDYSSMTLRAGENLVLEADLVPWSDGVKVKGSAPLKTPWRTVQIAASPGELITSYLVLNLNEPPVLEDFSWVQPGKYIGIWWGMHLDKWSWASGAKHGATDENTREYIDFAADHGFAGVLVEGWNFGWDGNWGANGEIFDFTTPYADFDLEALAAYARSRGVRLIGHHETGAAVTNYESQMEAAFALYQSLGINTVKTGYVGYGQGIKRFDADGNEIGREWHHGQYMVEHYRRVVKLAAQYGIMIDAHEPIKDTGIRRTYPNMMTREGARGQEYNAWDGQGGNPPDHVTILPFTRLLSGPMDYTPGVLGLLYPEYRPNNRVNHTLAKELALYVVIYSPLQMAADLIENYEDNPAFQFIVDVPVDWHETRVIHAEIGDFITTVRRERDGDAWYLGSVTDENGRTLDTSLDFLDPGVVYVAEIYADGEGADWDTNPYALDIKKYLVTAETVLTLELAPGGGHAIRFYPASEEEVRTIPQYK